MAQKLFTQAFVRVLPEIYATKGYFINSFGGALQIADGISMADKFMKLKTINTKVKLQPYSTDAAVAFGAGTGNTNRFGERTEIIAVDTDIPYEAPMAIHEGIDRMTVNDDIDEAVTERLIKNGEAWTNYLNGLLSAELSAKASETLSGELTEEGVAKVFGDAFTKLVNNEINEALTKRAYVTPQVYNLIIDSKLATTAKQSSANIDNNSILMFKGFVVELVPENKFKEGEQIYFAVDNVGVAGVGVEVVRAFESEDFAGLAIQGAGKFAKYIPEENNIGVLKATLTAAAPVEDAQVEDAPVEGA